MQCTAAMMQSDQARGRLGAAAAPSQQPAVYPAACTYLFNKNFNIVRKKMMSCRMLTGIVVCLVASAAGHGTLTVPAFRNNPNVRFSDRVVWCSSPVLLAQLLHA